MKGKFFLLLSVLFLFLTAYRLGECQTPQQIEQQYYNLLQQSAAQKANNPFFVKPFLVNAKLNYNYLTLMDFTEYYINNAQYNLNLPITYLNPNGINFSGTSSTAIVNNPFLQKKVAEIYKELPPVLYNANSSWLTMQQFYSHPTDYIYVPPYGGMSEAYIFYMGLCENAYCNNSVDIIYNMTTGEAFGCAIFAGVPPQTYLMNVDNEQKAAIILAVHAYLASQQQMGTLAQWMAQHPAAVAPTHH